MSKNNLLIYSVVSVGISLLLISMIRKMNGTNKDKVVESDSFEKIKDKEFIVIKPSNKTNFDVLFVFGGTSYATPDWMLKQMPQYILKSYLVILAPYTTSFNNTNKQLKDYLSKNNFKQKSLSVIGFSAGGYNAQSGYSKDLRYFGLIDPSTRSEYTSIKFGKNAHMVYNNSNWGAYPNIKKLQPIIANNVKSGGGHVEEVKLNHADIPKYFFEKHFK